MNIEDEIKQSKFHSELQKACLNIMFTSNWLNSKTSAILKPYGLTAEQYNVLRILRGQYPNPVMLGVIQERMLDKMSNASRLVDKLVEKKFVHRNICIKNRRQVDIIINKEGLDLLTKIDQPIMEDYNSIQMITVEEATILNKLLNKLRE